MGVTNLLQYLKPNEKCVNIKKYSGSVAAVDAMCWIHRGLISSAVANVRGELCDKFMKFIISMIALMLSFSITPIMVFDGYDMPAKKVETEIRREKREKAKKEALEMIRKNGNRINSDIMRKCMQAIHVTPEIIYRVITVCRKLNVPVIVSPYEADAQISYLCRSGIADFAVSEDSDLIVYGCPKVLYKLGRDGKAMEINVPFLTVSKNPFNTADCSDVDTINGTTKEERDKEETKVKQALETKVKDGLFKGLNHRMFVIMCVLSGTDYDNGWHISGMGLKVAYKLVLEHENVESILKSIYSNSKWADKVPELSCEGLLTHYTNVCNIFLHNIVFNPRNNQLVHINPVYTLNSFMDNNNMNSSGNLLGVSNGNLNSGTGSGDNFDLNLNTNLNDKLLRGYNYVYDMCLNIVNKGSNFINVARGLVSAVDDMEINYTLTATDLEIVDSLPEHISSYNKLNKTSKKDNENSIDKYMKVKFDLYAVNKDNSPSNKVNNTNNSSTQNKNTQFLLISTLCDSSLFSKLGSMDEFYKEMEMKSKLVTDDNNDKNKNNGVENQKVAENNKLQESNNNNMGVRTKLPDLPKKEALYRGNEDKVKDRLDEDLKQIKKEVYNDNNINGDVVKGRQTKRRVMNKEEKKRKVMELLNKTESYTVKRTKVKKK